MYEIKYSEINRIPAFLSTFSLDAIIITTIRLATTVNKTVGTARLAVTACGQITCPIPIDRVESTMQDPTISPMAIE